MRFWLVIGAVAAGLLFTLNTAGAPERARAAVALPVAAAASMPFTASAAFVGSGPTVAGAAIAPTDTPVRRPRLDLTRTPPGLSGEDALRAVTGRSLFADPWVEAGSTTTLRDGLGPLFNARTCTGCHAGGGRSSPPAATAADWQTTSGLVAKLGGAAGRPDPRYGEQLQPRSVYGPRRPAAGAAGAVARPGQPVGEGELQVSYRAIDGRYADGQTYRLWQPAYRAAGLTEGALARPAALTARIAPGLEGAALIEQVDEATILQRADPQDRDRDGISGRANRVPGVVPASPATALGRYGHKAVQPGLRQQTAAALHHDIGITSSLYPAEDCTPRQAACRSARSGAGPSSAFEIDDGLLDELVYFLRHLAVPAISQGTQAKRHQGGRRAERHEEGRMAGPHEEGRLARPHEEGRLAFSAARCTACHVPDPAYRGLYSDLLLHDLGPGLADGRREHLAGEAEWRTAPLAGLRLRKRLAEIESYLHDGRARSLEEAVLWHGGEARAARQAFTRMSAARRQALLAFLETL